MYRSLHWLLLSVTLLGCDPIDTETDTDLPRDRVIDDDGDGSPADLDCDDNNSDAYPGNTEICDGVDNDCDALTDEDVSTTFYADTDGDGFGDPSHTLVACTLPPHYAPNADDCDDTAADVNPDEHESCDAVDHNCDGDATAGATDAPLYFLDLDGDTYGDLTEPIIACERPNNAVQNSNDCNDHLSSINPGADEFCNGIDDDCDGHIDEGIPVDAQLWYTDSDHDGFGTDLVGLPTCEGPADSVANSDDCDDSAAHTYPGAPELCDGVDNDCDQIIPATELDEDGDGVAVCADDCDDHNPHVYPHAVDICGNNIDEDCDGTPDNGGSTDWYPDVDGDGYGAGPVLYTGCEPPAHSASNHTDCDDNEPTINPSMHELCNGGTDDDCDPSTTDEDSPTAPLWTLDQDGDGHGTPGGATLQQCDPPANYALLTDDCDDADPLTYTGAAEICDGLDNNCDQVVPASELDSDSDGVMVCESDCDDTDPTIYLGAPELCDGLDNDCDLSVPTDEADLDIDGIAACAGDCNDANNTIYPGADELCDGVDNDCDLRIDNHAVDAPTWTLDQDGDGHGALNNPTLVQCPDAHGGPSGYALPTDDCDDSDPNLAPGLQEVCGNGIDEDCSGIPDDHCNLPTVTHCGALSASEVWGPEAIHEVTCDIFVDNGRTLTVSGGTEVRFALNTGISVGTGTSAGTLRVDGGNDPVLFTHNSTATAGAWDGILLGANSTHSVVDGLTVEYGGNNSRGGIAILNSTVTVRNSHLIENLHDGVYVDGGVLTLEGSTFEANTRHGVSLTSSAQLAGGAHPSFTNNTFVFNPFGAGESEIVLPPNEVGKLATDNTLDPLSIIEVLNGSVQLNATWRDLGVPFVAAGSIRVQGPANPILTLEDGVEITFKNTSSALRVGDGDDGKLIANGSLLGVWLHGENGADWAGLHIGANDLGSILHGITINNGNDGIFSLSSAGIEVLNSDISHNIGSGIYLGSTTTASIQGTNLSDNTENGLEMLAGTELSAPFVHNTLTNNAEQPILGPPSIVYNLDPNTSFTGNGSDTIGLLAGSLQHTGHWPNIGVPYEIQGAVQIQGSADPSVTIDDGVELRFQSGGALQVGTNNDGSIHIEGTTEGVLFTTASPFLNPGSWRGVELRARTLPSTIDGLTLEYGGATNGAGLYIAGGAPVITRSTFRNNEDAGILVYDLASAPSISGSTFSGNTGFGVNINNTAGLPRDTAPTFVGNTLTQNAAGPIQLPANYLGELGVNQFSGNTVDAIMVLADTVDRSATWRAHDVPYHVTGNISVSANTNPVVTLDPGTTMKFAASIDLTIGATTTSHGTLLAIGSALEPILFTGLEQIPGYWDGIHFGGGNLSSSLAYATIEYAGNNGAGGIQVNNSDITLDHVTSQYNINDGIRLSTANATITNSSFDHNIDYGLNIDRYSTLSGTVGNAYTNNGTPAQIPSNQVHGLNADDLFTNNSSAVIHVSAAPVTDTQTWQNLGIPYQLTGNTVIGGPTNPVLSIAPGTELRFNPSAGLETTTSASDGGTLLSLGTVAEPIRFTSSQLLPAPGDWLGLRFQASDMGSELHHTTVEYAGQSRFANLTLSTGSLITLDNVTSQYASGHGLYQSIPGSSVLITQSSFLNNSDDGVHLEGSTLLARPGATFTDNIIAGNAGDDIELPVNELGGIDASSSLESNIHATQSNVTESAVWQNLGVPVQFASTVRVMSNGPEPIVEVADGVELQFPTNAGLDVGTTSPGSFQAHGGMLGIKLTSTDQTAGAWRGVSIGQRSTSSSFLNTTVEYGGSNSYGNIDIYGTHVPIISSTLTHSSTSGISLRGGGFTLPGSATVSDTEIANNNHHGVDISTYGTLGAGLSFVHNNLHDNADAAVRLPPEQVDHLSPSTIYQPNGAGVQISAGNISADTTWRALDADYELVGNLTVQDTTNPTLTIDDGVSVWVDNGHSVLVGNSADGGMQINGNTSGVLFTTSDPTPAPGKWAGITFGTHTTSCYLDGLTIEYAGSNSRGNLYVNGPCTIDGSLSRQGSRSGLEANGANAVVEVLNSTFTENLYYGVDITGTASLDDTNAPSFAGNNLEGNTLGPLRLPADSLAQLDPSTIYSSTGSEMVEVLADTVTASGTWYDLDAPLYFLGSTYIRGSSSPVITIEGGSELYFETGELNVGSSSAGGLITTGTPGNEVYFSSLDPTPGAWIGLRFSSACYTVLIDHAIVEYAGASNGGAVRFNNCNGATIQNTAINYSSNWGLYQSYSALTVSNMSYTGNANHPIDHFVAP